MTNNVEPKPPKQVKSCETCKHHTVNFCEDDDGNKVERLTTIHNTEPYWTYEACAKNWGLPKVAYVDGSKCQIWVAKTK